MIFLGLKTGEVFTVVNAREPERRWRKIDAVRALDQNGTPCYFDFDVRVALAPVGDACPHCLGFGTDNLGGTMPCRLPDCAAGEARRAMLRARIEENVRALKREAEREQAQLLALEGS